MIEPSSLPNIGPSTMMFAALHGELLLHPWRDPLDAQSDPYSLFLSRSSAMGCLTGAAKNAPRGLWGMNDAGQGPGPIASSSRVAWFQVTLTEPIHTGRPLPVQAFLSCAGDVLARVGTLNLQAVQVLLPLQSLPAREGLSSGMSALGSLLQDAGWFLDGDPTRRTQIRITLQGGKDLATFPAVSELLQWMQNINQDVFSCASYSLTDTEPVTLKPGIIDDLWGGPAHYRATFHGTLVEWSVDALGWLAAFLADACSRHGARTPVMFTATRSEKLDPAHQQT